MNNKKRNYEVLEAFCNGRLSLQEAIMAIKVPNRKLSVDYIRVQLLRMFDMRYAENNGNLEEGIVVPAFEVSRL